MRLRIPRTFTTDTGGGVAMVFGLVLPVLIGFSGLAVDGTYWMMERSKLQAAADSAALSAAQTIQLSGSDSAISNEAKKLMQKVYGQALTGVRYFVQHPPLSGPLQGNTTAVAVLAERDQPVYFLGLFGVSSMFVATRAVARVDSMNEACLLALSEDSDKAINITGSSTINLKCGIATNSASTQAVYLSGASNTTVTGVSAVGDVYQSNNAKLKTTDGGIKSNAAAITDPYGPEGRNIQAPTSLGSCVASKLKVKANVTLAPGRYCGGIDFTGGTTTFSPGVYYIDEGDFRANGNASLVGEDVTFVFTGKTGKVGELNINGGSEISLHAPKTGATWGGLLFFKPASESGQHCANGGGTATLNGNANLDLSGAIYLPSEQLTMAGGSSSEMSCLQVIANEIKITGNSSITGTCDESDGTNKIERSIVELME